MRCGVFAILLLGAGCRQLLGIDDPSVSSTDAATDTVPVDNAAIDAFRVCVGAAPYEVCMPSVPPPRSFIDVRLDTGSSTACAGSEVRWTSPQQPPACFLVGSTLVVAGLRATGSRPLVLVATESITITGLVDVASYRFGLNAGIGAGSPWSGCAAFPAMPENSMGGSGGGAGASFGGVGGAGGAGGAGGGGMTMAAAAPTYLRAGCAGQHSGTGNNGGAPGGPGGGAVYLAARSSITISGSGAINASGMGGDMTTSRSGGGGGGSGGMIVLWAPTIAQGPGLIIANGGGGSGGAEGGTGGYGGDPSPTSPFYAAGGPGTGNGGNGGNGGAINGVAAPGTPTTFVAGGGGGGGSVGYIQANHPLGGVSPPATIVP
jgi:hypothetical protein